MTILLEDYVGSKTQRQEVLNAVRTVIAYTISDVFCLTEEETMWTTYHLNKALEPLKDKRPRAIAAPVQHELATGYYSKQLAETYRAEPSQSNGSVAEADILDWAEMLAGVAIEGYNVRPLVAASLVGNISGVLMELGVGNPQNPRASKYLPNAVRHSLSA
jgi:hypothetical protein